MRVSLDPDGRSTHGKMVAHAAPPREERTLAHADGKDIQSVAIVNRAFKIASEVYSGKERHLVEVTQDMSFRNVQKYKAGGAKEVGRSWTCIALDVRCAKLDWPCRKWYSLREGRPSPGETASSSSQTPFRTRSVYRQTTRTPPPSLRVYL